MHSWRAIAAMAAKCLLETDVHHVLVASCQAPRCLREHTVFPERENRRNEIKDDSVTAYLRLYGIPDTRLTTTGFGESKPVGDNGTDDGHAINRRVELHRVG